MRFAVVSAVALLAAATTVSAAARRPPALRPPSFPIRAAFFYPWYPEAWRQQGLSPFSRYTPSLGYYASADDAVIRRQLKELAWGRITLAISSWWGRGDKTDVRLGRLLSVTSAVRAPVWWSVYYEPEGQGDPSVEQIRADLSYIRQRYARLAHYLRIGGRFVVFVYGDAHDGCATATRWHEANSVGAYVVLKVFPGYRSCSDQPDGWHQYGPAVAVSDQSPYSYTISPGFAKANEPRPRLARDPSAWRAEIRSMIASHARFQLVTTFNEWGEGTAVESAHEWPSTSGYGTYLDALHANGGGDATTTTPTTTTTTTTTPAPGGAPIVLAAGDIASCASPGDAQTAALIAAVPAATVLTLGDDAYESGSAAEFANCYGPTWGAFLSRTYPAVGNHEYLTAGAAPYWAYFGARAGPAGKGYYSFDLGAWHLISLNSNCSKVGGCGPGSPEETWLRQDLAAHPAACTLAFWHHPRFSSGEHGDFTAMTPIWNDLYAAGVDVVLNGHDHDYERFAPQTPDGVSDPTRGIREFVVGTGGKNHYRFVSVQPNSEVRDDTTFGVLQLTLRPTGYDWRFLPVAGQSFTDAGSAACH